MKLPDSNEPKMDPVSKPKLMRLLVTLNKVDQELYKFLNPNNRYPDQYEGWYFLSYKNVLNAIYYEFCGESEEVVYKQFKTNNRFGADVPTAWYEGEYSTKGDGSIKGPRGYKRFIPDCINDVILSHRLKPNQKLRLLTRMFGDLKKLKKEYEENKQ
jgi:hypothetical protein